MTPAAVLSELSRAGLSVRLDGEHLHLSGPREGLERFTPLVRTYKAELLGWLRAAPAMPPHITSALTDAGYSPPEWAPPACRAFLAELRAEWPGFRVRGWHGLAMPHTWPPAFRDAVQSVYVLSIQDVPPISPQPLNRRPK
ncbi:MAG: hypothetical protein EOM52_12050 [Clostridia bacterium]|nr:hypothetical protein [Clostridia bacterium]